MVTTRVCWVACVIKHSILAYSLIFFSEGSAVRGAQWYISGSGGSSYGRTGRPPSPHWPKIRADHSGAKQSASNTGANFHVGPKSLTFGHFFVWKLTKSFQLQGGSGGLRALAMVRPFPPMTNPGSATDFRRRPYIFKSFQILAYFSH